MAVGPIFGKILLRCVTEHDWSRSPDGLRELIAGADLSGLPEIAEAHGVAGYVYHRLKNVDGVDDAVVAALNRALHRGLSLHLRALSDLAVIRLGLDAASLPWIVAGGPLLIETVYPRVDLRSYRAFDAFVPSDAIPQVLRILEQSGGYAREGAQDRREGVRPEAILVVLRHGSEVRLRWKLHDGLLAGDDASALQEAFARSRSISVQRMPVNVFDSADTLIVLALRALHDVCGDLGNLKDVERTIAKAPPHWEDVVTRARSWAVHEPVAVSLRRARDLLDADVPGHVIQRLSGRHDPRSVRPRPQPSGPAATPSVSRVEAALLGLVHIEPTAPVALSERDWDNVRAIAVRERVAPLVWSALSDGCAPEGVGRALMQQYRESAAAGVAAGVQIAEVLGTLRAEGIVPLLLKGAALAPFIYQDPALRPFSDVDLLVLPEEVNRVNDCLRRTGYEIRGDAPTPADFAWRHGRGYYDPEGIRMTVDVHWRFSGYPHIVSPDYVGVFTRARRLSLGGEMVLLPSPADLVVASSIYFVRELWYGKPKLRYLRDVAEVARRCAIDWEQVLRTASQAPFLRSSVFLALRGAADLLGATVPAAPLAALRPRRWPGVATHVAASVSQHLLRQEHPLHSLAQFALLRLVDGDSLLAFLQWAKALLFVPKPLATSQRRWLRRFWQV